MRFASRAGAGSARGAGLRGVFLALLTLAGCGGDGTPEARLRAAIAGMEAAAEAGDRSEFLSHVAADFAGPSEAADRAGLAELFRIQLLANTRVRAVLSGIEVELFDDRARVRMRALLTGGPRAWLPEAGGLYRIETGWRREGSRWLLISAAWEPVAGG